MTLMEMSASFSLLSMSSLYVGASLDVVVVVVVDGGDDPVNCLALRA